MNYEVSHTISIILFLKNYSSKIFKCGDNGVRTRNSEATTRHFTVATIPPVTEYVWHSSLNCKSNLSEPDFVKFKELYKDHVEILGIDFEDTNVETIQSFIKDFNINYPILVTDVYNPTEFEKENSLGLPTTVFFDKNGVQFDKRVGPVHFEDLVEITKIEKLVHDLNPNEVGGSW